ncbi:MAG: hypothetical protein R3F30_07715 [Planctomycetota bacterium]
MNLAGIALRNVRQRLLTSWLTTVSVLLGTALVAFLWLAARQAEATYQRAYLGYPVVIGPKEMSRFDLVLNTVYHKGVAQGVLPLSLYEEIHDGRWKHRLGTRFAIPFVVGDSYKGFRLIGTTSDFFTEFGYERNADRSVVPLAFAAGGPFAFSHADLLAEAKRQSDWSKVRATGEDGVVAPRPAGVAQGRARRQGRGPPRPPRRRPRRAVARRRRGLRGARGGRLQASSASSSRPGRRPTRCCGCRSGSSTASRATWPRASPRATSRRRRDLVDRRRLPTRSAACA